MPPTPTTSSCVCRASLRPATFRGTPCNRRGLADDRQVASWARGALRRAFFSGFAPCEEIRIRASHGRRVTKSRIERPPVPGIAAKSLAPTVLQTVWLKPRPDTHLNQFIHPAGTKNLISTAIFFLPALRWGHGVGASAKTRNRRGAVRLCRRRPRAAHAVGRGTQATDAPAGRGGDRVRGDAHRAGHPQIERPGISERRQVRGGVRFVPPG